MIFKKNLLVFECPIKILILILENKDRKLYANELAKGDFYFTYSHVSSILKRFLEMGLIVKQKEGRVIYVSLTKKGLSIAKCFQNINNLLNHSEA